MALFCRRISVAFAAVLVLAIGIMPSPAATQTVDELQRKLAERDTVIADLLRRVEALESRDAATPGEAQPSARAQAAPKDKASSSASTNDSANDPLPGTQRSVETPPVAGSAPGQFEVDETTTQRALERALIQTGALLLEPGSAEIEPSLSYTYFDRDAPLLLSEEEVGTGQLRRNVLEAGIGLRFGLPFSSQVEFDLPYKYEHQSFVTRTGPVGIDETSRNASGFSDFAVTLSKALLQENGWQPDLIAAVRWDTNSGASEREIPPGSGFNEVTASLSAVKRIDPLAVIGSLSYTTAFENHNVDPGDRFGFSLGTVLATGPDTSLRLFLNQELEQKVEVGGRKEPGSDNVISSLTLGGSVVLGPMALLDISANIGLTPEAPDYSFLVSLPIRFDLPILQ